MLCSVKLDLANTILYIAFFMPTLLYYNIIEDGSTIEHI